MSNFVLRDTRAAAQKNASQVRQTAYGSGIVVGQTVAQAKQMMSAQAKAEQALRLGRHLGQAETDEGDLQEMRQARLRKANRHRTSMLNKSSAYTGNTDLSLAWDRPRDLEFYYQQSGLPWDFTKPEELIRLRHLCRHIYRSHPVMGSALDIYSTWPLVGMAYQSKDEKITDFYSELFLDRLNYEEFLPQVLMEYFLVGEAFPMGYFNEELGIWESDELVNPDDVFVEKSMFIAEPELSIRLPSRVRQILVSRQPVAQYQALVTNYPQLKNYSENSVIPVSNVLMKHLKFGGDTFAPRGISILNRAMRALMQEEMLNAARDSIADRLSTPLILAKIGATAGDLGTQDPWIPGPAEIDNFEASLNAALAADFRIMTTHFAVQIESVFGKESMPNFDSDFDNFTDRQLQAFGMSKTMLSGSDSGQTYAADALNRDLVSQLLGKAQRKIRKFCRARAEVVAEAREHYDYEMRNGIRYPIMEEVLVVDDETGEQKIVEQPKLLVPDLILRTMNLKSEQDERTFIEALRSAGVPISQSRRVQGLDLDLGDEIERTAQEQVDQAVQAQLVRKRTYEKLRDANLPIPEDLENDFGPKAAPAGGAPGNTDLGSSSDGGISRIPSLGLDGPDTSALAPTDDQQKVPPGQPLGVDPGQAGEVSNPNPASQSEVGAQPDDTGGATVVRLPRNRMLQPDDSSDQPTRPEESDEQRAGMPRSSVKFDSPRHLGMRRNRHPEPDWNAEDYQPQKKNEG